MAWTSEMSVKVSPDRVFVTRNGETLLVLSAVLTSLALCMLVTFVRR